MKRRLNPAQAPPAAPRHAATCALALLSLVAAAAVSRRRRRLLAERAACVMNDDGASLATGVAGVRDVRAVKCLHAHVAHALAHPAYLFGTAVAEEVVDPWCDDRRCAAFVPEPAS